MSEKYLIDTGFLVALLDAKDPDHASCVTVWRGIRGTFFSVEGVLVETAHLVGNDPNAVAAAIAMMSQVGVRLHEHSPPRAARAIALMRKYQDVPMDYVDADLVALAEEEHIERVLTLDVRGFSVFRKLDRLAFAILPTPLLVPGRRRRPRRHR